MRIKFILVSLLLLCAACTGTPTPFDLPTLAVLPSLSPSELAVAADSSATPPLLVTIITDPLATTPIAEQAVATITLPVPTEQLQAWYTSDMTPIYACAEITCDVLTNFPAGVQLFVIGTENGWHEILLARQRGRYVEARLTTQATPQPMTATAGALIVDNGEGSQPPFFSPGESAPPTASIDELPPNPGPDVTRTTPGPTSTFLSGPPVTLLPNITTTMPFTTGVPPGEVYSGTATPQGSIAPPNMTNEPTATFLFPEYTIVPVTPSATPPNAPPGVNPNLPTATPFIPRPPGM